MRVVAEHKEVQQVAWERWEQPGTPRMSWHRRDRRGPRQGQINNEKPQVCGLRAPAKGLLADFAPPRKGGGEAAGIRYVAKTGKVLVGLRLNSVFGVYRRSFLCPGGSEELFSFLRAAPSCILDLPTPFLCQAQKPFPAQASLEQEHSCFDQSCQSSKKSA